MGKFILFLLIVLFSLFPPFQDWKSAEIYYLLLKLFKIYSYAKNVTSLSEHFLMHRFCDVCAIDIICIGMKTKCKCILPFIERSCMLGAVISILYILFYFYFVIILWNKDNHSHLRIRKKRLWEVMLSPYN